MFVLTKQHGWLLSELFSGTKTWTGCCTQVKQLTLHLPFMFFIATDGFCIFLQPERFVNLGIEPPKGVLLFGPPGTGKTLCARAVANRTDACFIRVIGSELVQKYVGEVCDNLCEFF